MEDVDTKFMIKNINEKMIYFITNSNDHIDEFYKSLNKDELFIYAQESKRGGDIDTYNKLIKLINEKFM